MSPILLTLAEYLVAFLLVIGGGFILIGSWGLARLPSLMTRNSSASGALSRVSAAFINPGRVPVTLVTACSRMRLASRLIGSSPLSRTNTVRSSRNPASPRSA